MRNTFLIGLVEKESVEIEPSQKQHTDMKLPCFGLRFKKRRSDQTNLIQNQILQKEKTKLINPEEKSDLNNPDGLTFERFIDINALSSSWYLPNISEDKSTEILTPLVNGRFVIRRVETGLVLHLREQGRIRSYPLVLEPVGWRFAGEDKVFSNLSSLVVHHSIMQESLSTPLVVAEHRTKEEEQEEEEEVDFIDIDVDPEFSDLVSRLQNKINF